MVMICDPWADSPKPSEEWMAMSEQERLEACNRVTFVPDIAVQPMTVISAPKSGLCDVALDPSLTAAERGLVMRGLEYQLQQKFGGIYVWVKPMQDKNRLRRLRGVTVK